MLLRFGTNSTLFKLGSPNLQSLRLQHVRLQRFTLQWLAPGLIKLLSLPPLPSWASIAAAGPPENSTFLANHSNPQRNFTSEITIRPGESNSQLRNAKSPAEILEILGENMERTVPLAAKKLQSGDIRLVVQNKDFLLRNRESIQAKVQATLLRQSFPLEVCGVPLSLGVKSGKAADNSTLLRTLSTTNGKLVSGVQFSRIGWMPNRNRSDTPKTRGSLILGVDNPTHQAECIKKGVLIEGQLYTARLYDYNLQLIRCYL